MQIAVFKRFWPFREKVHYHPDPVPSVSTSEEEMLYRQQILSPISRELLRCRLQALVFLLGGEPCQRCSPEALGHCCGSSPGGGGTLAVGTAAFPLREPLRHWLRIKEVQRGQCFPETPVS